MSNSIDLSIVIVSHGHESMLRACISSLAGASEGLSSEIIVIDNLKAGLVAPALRGFEITLLENDRPAGFAANINRGSAAARGQYLLILNPDTEHRSGRLADGAAFLSARSDVGILGCALLNSDGTHQQSYRRFPTIPFLLARGLGADRWRWRPAYYRRRLMAEIRYDHPHQVDWVFGAFMLLRRQEYMNAGGMDEGFRLYYEDVELCHRFRNAGLSTYFFPSISFVHTHLRASASAPLGQRWRWHVRSAIRYFWKSKRYASSLD